MDYSNLAERFGSQRWTEQQESTLLEPYSYISQNPGKEIRSALVEAFNLWLDVPKGDLEVINGVVRMLHNASLLMDDVEDNSQLRRGLPVAHTIYGIPQTINTANYVYFLAMKALLSMEGVDGDGKIVRQNAGDAGGGTYGGDQGEGQGKAEGKDNGKGKGREVDLMGVVTDELLNLHRGQGLDLFWRDSLTCPTEEEYVQMVLGKTGGLFRIAVKLMMARSNSDVDYVPLVNLVSIFFQIRDDYMNLQSTEYADNKGFAEDLTEGKFSFPVVHGVRADPSNRQILNVLQKQTTNHDLKVHTVNYLRNHTKSFTYTREVLRTIRLQIEEEVKRLGGNVKLERILAMLHIPEEDES